MTHIGQKTPILNGQLPIVETGAEYLVPQLTSSKFAHTAKESGKVLDVSPNEYITIQYESGKIQNLDILPRYTATKRNSTIQITMNSLEKGDEFQKGQMLAWSKAFGDGDGLSIGRNTMLAVMNYNGLSFEDAYVVSEGMADQFITENIIRVPIVIPANTKVINVVNQKFINTDSTTPLIEFQYLSSIEDYINNYELLEDDFNEDEESLFEKTQNTLKRMSPGGEVVDIRIKLNTKTNIDPFLITLWEEQKKKVNQLEKTLTKYATNEDEKLVDNIDFSVLRVGGHKLRAREFDGALIEYFIKQPSGIKIGNKLANRFGAKGIVSHIIPKNKTPYGTYTPNIDVFIASSGVLGRKNTSILKEIFIGKIFYFLPEIVSKKLTENETIDNVKKLIIEIYEILDPTKEQKMVKSIVTKFESIKPATLKESLINKIIRFNYLIPPFNTPEFKDIKKAAKILGIPLTEKIFIPELGVWTKDEVAVGPSYFSTLEQLSSDYESTRGVAGYVSATGQPTVKLAVFKSH